jgi:UDP-N-acetylglucosamine 2-epimerase
MKKLISILKINGENLGMSLVTVVGTRPNFMKMALIIKSITDANIPNTLRF